ncbi:hypothetical protein A4R44_01790 [Amycolatopsis sp. M39]|nr:hypothetical protein A4R44_01790 [Amycolatopsis sp. M39]
MFSVSFHGSLMKDAIGRAATARPSAPAPAPAVRLISDRRAMPLRVPASARWARMVARSTSADGPSLRCCTEVSCGTNFLV